MTGFATATTTQAALEPSWPSSSSPEAFRARRRRLRERLGKRVAVLASGFPRAINFPSNCFPFRAESHFLFLVGAQFEGAVLELSADRECLYLPGVDPSDRLWHGPSPTHDEISRQLGIQVADVAGSWSPLGAATIPPQCPRAAAWLSERLRRRVSPGRASCLEGQDAELADALIALRLRHDAPAVEQLRQAAAATVEAHRAGMRATRVGQREAQVSAVMRASIDGAGMRLAYAPIVTVEGNVLHGRGHAGRLNSGDLLLADVGAETPEGWAADVTRTWPVSGRYSTSQRELYEVVLQARQAALNEIRPGGRFLDVHRASQRGLVEGLIGLGILRGGVDELMELGAATPFYPHGVGHLLGLDVHDMEDLGDRAGYGPGRVRGASSRFLRLDRDLEPGMLVTIEPGFYRISELLEAALVDARLRRCVDRDRLHAHDDVRGIRVEDDVLVTEQGFEVLSGGLPTAASDVEALLRR